MDPSDEEEEDSTRHKWVYIVNKKIQLLNSHVELLQTTFFLSLFFFYFYLSKKITLDVSCEPNSHEISILVFSEKKINKKKNKIVKKIFKPVV